MNYTVKSGDTLSIIARDILGDISRWPEIAKLNNLSAVPTLVATNNPIYLIFPGQVLILPDPGSKAAVPASTSTLPGGTVAKQATIDPWPMGLWGVGALVLLAAAIGIGLHRHKMKKKAKSGPKPKAT